MDKKYSKYTVEDFARDLRFINWVKRGSDHEKWENFIRENPHLSKDIETAKKIIEALHSRDTIIDEEEIYAVWKNVELFYELLHHKPDKKVRFIKFMRYAAVFVLALSIGAAIPIYYFTHNSSYFSEIEFPSSSKQEAKLTLAGGEEILLKEKQTKLQFDVTGSQIKIDKDSVINYQTKIEKNAMARIEIPFGMRSDICLSDGTRVWLNAGSVLTFPQKFTGKNRKVFLEGEAYFDVTKNKEAPFIVSSDNLNVTVLGTKFNMRDDDFDDESAEVVLIEGSVSLKENSLLNFMAKEISLGPNQKAVYLKEKNKTIVESDINTEYYTSWKEGLLEFKRESILNVLNRLSRFYNVHFITEKNAEFKWKFSGKLDLEKPLEEVLRVVSDAAPITYRFNGNQVFVNIK